MKVELEKVFPMPVTADIAWAFLKNIEGVAGCVPGAKITGRREDGRYLGTINVRLGPANLSFKGEIEVRELDAAQRTLRLSGKGSDSSGTSGASMDLTARIDALSDTQCNLNGKSEVSMSGKAAAFGGRMMGAVADQILKQFAANFAIQASELASVATPAADGTGAAIVATTGIASAGAGAAGGGAVGGTDAARVAGAGAVDDADAAGGGAVGAADAARVAGARAVGATDAAGVAGARAVGAADAAGVAGARAKGANDATGVGGTGTVGAANAADAASVRAVDAASAGAVGAPGIAVATGVADPSPAATAIPPPAPQPPSTNQINALGLLWAIVRDWVRGVFKRKPT